MKGSENTPDAVPPSLSTAGLEAQIYRHFSGMCWPAAGSELSNLGWAMRYGSAEHWRFAAASVIEAYAELIDLPERKRNAIIKELRKGPGKKAPNLKGEQRP